MIQNFPPEILFHIFRCACVDQGVTARSLSLTSKYLSSASSRFLFYTLYLAGPDNLQRALRRLSLLPPHLREVCHLFVADTNGQTFTKLKAYHSEFFDHVFPDLVSQLLRLAAPTLRTLTVVISTEHISGILEGIAHTTMPNLTDLTLSFNPTRIIVRLDNPAPLDPLKAHLPRLRHLHISTCNIFSTTVPPAVALIAAHAPRLATLHVTDVHLMPGCASALARMLGRLPLRHPYGFFLTSEVLNSPARLPFSVREFVLQVRDWPQKFTSELELIERMAGMDYGDGFVLLPPAPMGEQRQWKERWLAAARKSLECV